MRKRNVFAWATSAMLVMTTGFTACSDDESIEDVESIKSEIAAAGATDIAHGVMAHAIDASNLEQYKMPLAVLSKVDVEIEKNDYYGVRVEEIDGTKYIVPYQKKEQESMLLPLCVSVQPKGHAELRRNVFLIFTKPENQTRAVSYTTNREYLASLGKTTFYHGDIQKLTNPHNQVFSVDTLLKYDAYSVMESAPSEEVHYEHSSEHYESTVDAFSLNVGVSRKKTRENKAKKVNIKDGVLNVADGALGSDAGELLEALDPLSIGMGSRTRVGNDADAISKSFSLDFGISGTISVTRDYEIFCNIYKVAKTAAHVVMSNFEHSQAFPMDKAQFCLMYQMTNPNFIRALKNCNLDYFTTKEFYDDWGTDIVTQGTFGGGNYYLYARAAGAYETEIGVDAMASFRKTYIKNDKDTTSGDWMKIFKAKNQDYVSASAEFTYNHDHYSEASQAWTFEKSFGGNLATSNDVNTWLAGFNDDSKSKNWNLLSYTYNKDFDTPSDNDSTMSCLYPIDVYIQNLAVGYYDALIAAGMTPTAEDMTLIQKVVTIAERLADERVTYIANHATAIYEARPVVLADFIMLKGKNGHKTGEPKPFIGENPLDRKKYLIYYPIMANRLAPTDQYYAFETSQDDYVVTWDSEDQYWYYALTPSDTTQAGAGISDIIFETEGNVKDASAKGQKYYNYVQRGDDSRPGGVASTNKHVYVRFYSSNDKDLGKEKITAAGFWTDELRKKNSDLPYCWSIIASTGGSELSYPHDDLDTIWENFWNTDKAVYTDMRWHKGGLVESEFHNKIKLCYTTQPLVKEKLKNIRQPLKWGEESTAAQ